MYKKKNKKFLLPIQQNNYVWTFIGNDNILIYMIIIELIKKRIIGICCHGNLNYIWHLFCVVYAKLFFCSSKFLYDICVVYMSCILGMSVRHLCAQCVLYLDIYTTVCLVLFNNVVLLTCYFLFITKMYLTLWSIPPRYNWNIVNANLSWS